MVIFNNLVYKTPKYNDYFKENFRTFDVLDFIAEVTAHIPPKNKQYIRRYGLYSSRTRGIWERSPHVVRLAPSSWQEKHKKETDKEEPLPATKKCSMNEKQQKSTWARLIKKVYGVNPLVCSKCGKDMKIIAIILDPEETTKILQHLIKIGRPPPNFDLDSLH